MKSQKGVINDKRFENGGQYGRTSTYPSHIFRECPPPPDHDMNICAFVQCNGAILIMKTKNELIACRI